MGICRIAALLLSRLIRVQNAADMQWTVHAAARAMQDPGTDFVLPDVFTPAMLPTVNANAKVDKCDATLTRASPLFMFFRLPVVRHRRRSAL